MNLLCSSVSQQQNGITYGNLLTFFGSLLGAAIPIIILIWQNHSKKVNDEREKVENFIKSYNNYKFYFDKITETLDDFIDTENKETSDVTNLRNQCSKSVEIYKYCFDKINDLDDSHFTSAAHDNFMEVKYRLDRLIQRSDDYITHGGEKGSISYKDVLSKIKQSQVELKQKNNSIEEEFNKFN